MEIRDSSEQAFQRLLTLVNNHNRQNITYSGRTSPRFGRTNSKEQYGLLYNPTKVKLENESEIAVHKRDFERPPYCYSFKTVEKKPLTFAALVTHIDPDAVSTEMDNLYETVKQCTHASRTENIIVLGDMNAGCRYLSKKKKRELKFVKDSSFKWLISDDMDTTVAGQDCALDRFIVRGETLISRIVPNSAKPMKFDEILKLSPNLTRAVSDHYPIQMEIR
ncbi:hypothetical protein AAHC03_024417 [Spirometra sp. Aus1]